MNCGVHFYNYYDADNMGRTLHFNRGTGPAVAYAKYIPGEDHGFAISGSGRVLSGKELVVHVMKMQRDSGVFVLFAAAIVKDAFNDMPIGTDVRIHPAVFHIGRHLCKVNFPVFAPLVDKIYELHLLPDAADARDGGLAFTTDLTQLSRYIDTSNVYTYRHVMSRCLTAVRVCRPSLVKLLHDQRDAQHSRSLDRILHALDAWTDHAMAFMVAEEHRNPATNHAQLDAIDALCRNAATFPIALNFMETGTWDDKVFVGNFMLDMRAQLICMDPMVARTFLMGVLRTLVESHLGDSSYADVVRTCIAVWGKSVINRELRMAC